MEYGDLHDIYYTEESLFDGASITWEDSQQSSNIENSGFMAALCHLANTHEHILKQRFKNDDNEAGIFGVTLYLRAKPYLMTLDENIWMEHTIYNK